MAKSTKAPTKTVKVTSVASGKVYHPSVDDAEVMKANPMLKKKYTFEDLVADPPELLEDETSDNK